MDTVDRIINKLESRKLDRALGDIIRKLEGDLQWEQLVKIECKAYDRNGELIVNCEKVDG